jgi:hypothetical protein
VPEFRAYAAWRHILEEQGTEPTADELALVRAERGNSGAAYTVAKLQRVLDGFPRRHATARHRLGGQQHLTMGEPPARMPGFTVWPSYQVGV